MPGIGSLSCLWPKALTSRIWAIHLHHNHNTLEMFALSLATIWKLFAVFLVLFAVLDLLTMSEQRRVRLLRSQGLTQKAISERLNITTYRVRKALAA
jgi:hypothetical protein